MKFLLKKRVRNACRPRGFWGAITLANMNDEHATLTDKGLSMITIADDATCLDVGCGGGRTLSRLSELAPKGKIYGIDISETSVKCAKKYNYSDVKSGKIIIKRGRAFAIPYPANTFDVITAVETFYFWENKPLALKNLCEVMKKNGTLIIMLDAYEDGSSDMDEIKGEINLELTLPSDMEEMLKNAGFMESKVVLDGKRMYAIAKK